MSWSLGITLFLFWNIWFNILSSVKQYVKQKENIKVSFSRSHKLKNFERGRGEGGCSYVSEVILKFNNNSIQEKGGGGEGGY